MSAVIDAELPESPANRGAALTAADIETNLVDLLAGVLKAESESIAVDSHFFEELGADSLVMAHFCARIRKQGSLPSVSMRDIYRYPTIGALAASLAETASAGTELSRPAPTRAATPTSAVEQALCGVA
ncbi:MAG TPA: acyl carrier protein, partial [Gammaproteobacteria bacterium]|nr:acyl carrier protein [Gammaproteobacteria bacterium]